ncbi:MAG TPA: hypothetical protein VKY19_17420 [Ktedonosporobacter sp.]|nr:hypothetical protein [Ktedonosporobacter sp.]
MSEAYFSTRSDEQTTSHPVYSDCTYVASGSALLVSACQLTCQYGDPPWPQALGLASL